MVSVQDNPEKKQNIVTECIFCFQKLTSPLDIHQQKVSHMSCNATKMKQTCFKNKMKTFQGNQK